MTAGQKLFEAVQKNFFANFRVSVMLDSNGSNTTAAAGVAKLMTSGEIKGKKVAILAGTGPVGQRAAVMMAKEGAGEVVVGSRKMSRAKAVCEAMKNSFNVELVPAEATNCDANGKLIEDAQIVFATGAAGIELIKPEHWEDNGNIESEVRKEVIELCSKFPIYNHLKEN